MAKIPPGVGPRFPQVVVLFGATGDLARRKLLPGLFHLATAGFIPGCRIIGVSLDDIDADAFRAIAAEKETPLNALAAEIDAARRGEEGLASAIRVFCLNHYRRP